MKGKFSKSLITLIGFALSPASWWNDLLVNFPLSYVLAVPFGLLNKSLFLPMFIVNYWLTNIFGILLMHYGIKGIIKPSKESTSRNEIKNMVIFSIFYTGVILILVLSGILDFPEEFLEKFSELVK